MLTVLYLPLRGDGAVGQERQRGHVVVSEAGLIGSGHIAEETVHAPIAAPLSHVHCCSVQNAEGIPVDPPARKITGSSDSETGVEPPE